MKTVILCGGIGTRLREQTEFRPKPMVEVGGRPILWHIMKVFAHHGLREFVLCLGYKGHIIKDYFLNYEAMNNDFTVTLQHDHRIQYHGRHEEQGYTVTLADTGAETMTGARVKRVQRYIDGDTFMVTYGDGIADINIARLLEFHRAHGKLATVTSVRPISRFGVLDLQDDGVVKRFVEKPQSESWINVGFFVFDRRVFDYIDDDDARVLEREPLERLAAEGQMVAYRHEGFFFAMDTYREYESLNRMWDSGQAPWKVW
ncbi:MAG: glucose-1-phosphate cytidylyltransferase [Thermoguttaceae bacterium]